MFTKPYAIVPDNSQIEGQRRKQTNYDETVTRNETERYYVKTGGQGRILSVCSIRS